ncbi:TOMM precursor leader peptide-binding protein [Paenibacillus sp. sptzw28]|uniref:TOMM precursor leader peptide-binding protein n=1 Tax=Paenibacillus sp. sptzw28 TaxID=715179 RepID=UPI001C6E9309|nr:TOMM precursor leader peptide-binding protein [Paenibacillus sp. sptzw28]QYR20282.1 TOMM precursor leader peptide-binding protein [Paenibacillus sp. sptzw28]
MSGFYRWKPYFQVERLEREAAFALSEAGHAVFTDPLYIRLSYLINGKSSNEEIVQTLSGHASSEEVYKALSRLEQQGYIEVAPETEQEQFSSGFWSILGKSDQLVRSRLSGHSIAVHDLTGNNYREQLNDLLSEMEIPVSDEGRFVIVVTDDYLDERVHGENRKLTEQGRPWMPVKPGGFIPWVGPIFTPGHPPCYSCLSRRLQENSKVDSYLRSRGIEGLRPYSLAGNPLTVRLALTQAALQTTLQLCGNGAAVLSGQMMSLRTLQGTADLHAVAAFSDCAECGGYLSKRHNEKSHLDPAPLFSRDGGYRSMDAMAVLQRYKHHISPITGIVHSLEKAAGEAGRPYHVYYSSHNFAMNDQSLPDLLQGLRARSAGKGTTDLQAQASALCEALERYSGVFRGDEPRLTASYRDLGDLAIHPNEAMLFSDNQYAVREAWMAKRTGNRIVPHPFDINEQMEWTPICSPSTGKVRYLPSSYLYFGYPLAEQSFRCWPDSNGNAAGQTLEEAIVQGFLELIERDSAAIWWYNRLPRPAIDLAGMGHPFVDELQAYYRSCGREFWVLDVTADSGIPAYAAINRRVGGPAEQIMMGFGSHFDARTAVLRAISEMNQYMPALEPGPNTPFTVRDPDLLDWWRSATVANQPYLAPYCLTSLRDSIPASSGPGQLIQWCLDACGTLGLELYIVDQTRTDVGLPVVKVIVPGLRHFWARFAPGRLYDVPVNMGWLPSPLAEESLNPIPMFL